MKQKHTTSRNKRVFAAPGSLPSLSAHIRSFAKHVGRHLSVYYVEETEVPKLKIDGYENVPTLAGMADVFINDRGFIWNKKARSKSPPPWCRGARPPDTTGPYVYSRTNLERFGVRKRKDSHSKRLGV